MRTVTAGPYNEAKYLKARLLSGGLFITSAEECDLRRGVLQGSAQFLKRLDVKVEPVFRPKRDNSRIWS